MSTSRLLRVLPALLLTLALPANAQEKAAADAMAKLVPPGTAIFLQARSLEALAKALRDVVHPFDPATAEKIDVDSILSDDLDLPGDLAHVDRTRPIAVCLVLAESPDEPPAATFLVPASNVEAYVQSISGSPMPRASLGEDRYVAVSAVESKRPSAADPIALGLPAGEIVARFDLERIIDLYRPMIEPGLDQLEGMMSQMPPEATGGIDMKPMMSMYADGARALIDSADALDLALALRGDQLDFTSSLTTLENSVMATFASKERTTAVDLARFLDPQAGVSMVFGVDMAAMTKRFLPLLPAVIGVYPEPMRASLTGMSGKFEELAALSGNAFAVCGDFAPGGMRLSYYLRPRDAKQLFDTYVQMMRSIPGITLDVPSETTVDGVAVSRVRLKLDFSAFPLPSSDPDASQEVREQAQAQLKAMLEAMYGKDGMTLALASKGGVTAIVLGGDEEHLRRSIGRLGGSGGVPSEMQKRLDQVTALHPFYVVHYDVGSVMRWMGALTGEALGGGPAGMFSKFDAVFTFWGGIDNLIWRGGLSCNLAELGKSFRAVMEESMSEGKRAKAQADITTIANALAEYASRNAGTYPDSLAVLVVPDVNGAKYLSSKAVPKDPWGNDYLYAAPAPGKPEPRVYSFGADGKEGGEGDDADIEGIEEDR